MAEGTRFASKPLLSRSKLPFWLRMLSNLELFLIVTCLVLVIIALIFLGLFVSNKNSSSTTGRCLTTAPQKQTQGMGECKTRACMESASHMTHDMNTSVDPCEDFHLYSCGGWASRHSRGLTQREHTPMILQEFMNNEKLLLILRDGVDRLGPKSYEQKTKLMFRSCYNGFGVIGSKFFIQNILSARPEGVHLFGTFQPKSFNVGAQLKRVHGDFWTDVLFGVFVDLDWKDASKRRIRIHSAGRGVNMLYYVDPNLSRMRSRYETYMRKTLKLLIRDKGITAGDMDIEATVDTFVADVMRIESKLEMITLRSTRLSIHKEHLEAVTLQQLTADTGGFINFTDVISYMFNDAGVNANTQVVALDHDYLQPMVQYLSTLGANSSRIIHNYFTWRLIHKYTEHLTWEYIYAAHEFYATVTGDKRMPSAEYACYMRLTQHMSLALSALFGKEHMEPEDKTYVKSMLNHIEQAALRRLPNLQWMSAETKKKAEAKLRSIVTQIGTADFMDSDAAMDKIYERLVVTGHYLQDMFNLDQFQRADANSYLKSGNKRSLWGPWSTYRAGPFYMGALNEIIAPVGMFHQPLYRRGRPSYNNFATTGMMLGYMVFHAYNEYGSDYVEGGFEVSDDGDKMVSWWSDETTNAFLEAEKCVIDYYNNKTAGPFDLYPYKITTKVMLSNVTVDSVIDEQTAVIIAYEAMKTWEVDNGVSDPLIGLNMTHDQLFFTAYAQMRCINTLEYSTYIRVRSGKLPWDMLVNGILGHTDQFNQAFNCPTGSPMNVEERCQDF